ncbi:MAG: tRNA pseudouridine(55) synthase TruB [Desulfobulbaceae bacterium]|nr:tRNA pseudouridine(55) synthase TruB [Desulfobulbaceae bacterium]
MKGNTSEDRSDFKAGVFLVDKPVGVSSFAVIRWVRKLIGIKKVGHAGTLDPFATGLLVVCAGRPATRMIDSFMGGVKAYEAVLQLGVATDTLDTEGAVTTIEPVVRLNQTEIDACLQSFIGEGLQAPPAYSAVKYKGKPLYHYARKGVVIIKPPRVINIHSIDFISYDLATGQLKFSVLCGKGVYIRVLAADIANKLGTCGHLTALRRTRCGNFFVERAVLGNKLSSLSYTDFIRDHMMSTEEALAMNSEKEYITSGAPDCHL